MARRDSEPEVDRPLVANGLHAGFPLIAVLVADAANPSLHVLLVIERRRQASSPVLSVHANWRNVQVDSTWQEVGRGTGEVACERMGLCAPSRLWPRGKLLFIGQVDTWEQGGSHPASRLQSWEISSQAGPTTRETSHRESRA